ncbi:CLUMA_CG004880, isoform A, partial [Clunio marinus]
SARFCEGGNHKCLPPKECCAQGCCYLYSPPSAPRSAQPTDHVLNLFFISHWYFWLFLLAILISLLLFCSLWKKRRTFCSGWSTSSSHRTTSEGDSAGSCYAPPHYSRCTSFYHAPPPYTEVTSKPELYPLVFTYTSDASKNSSNGANYLMVQYFRNYIVRPIGSLSAASTVDSLSSSFICTANESNTMIPPPYSDAASPDALSVSLQNYAIPRSSSQQGYINNTSNFPNNDSQYRDNNRPMSVPNTSFNQISSNHQLHTYESANVMNLNSPRERESCVLIRHNELASTLSNSTVTTTHTSSSRSKNQNAISDDDDDDDDFYQASSGFNLSQGNFNTGMNFNSSVVGGQTQTLLSNNAISLSAAMMDKISYSRKTNDNTKLNMIQKQLEKCCEMIQQQQQQIAQTRSHFNVTSSFDNDSPLSGEASKKICEMPTLEGYNNSNTGSTVSSLANFNSLGSPPQATSPTQEVKELLEQINQLKDAKFSDENLNNGQACEYDNLAQDTASYQPVIKRPTSFNSKRKFFNMKNRSVYMPMTSSFVAPNIVSPRSVGNFMMKAGMIKGRNGWVSRSAPTTPATFLPATFTTDKSPLLSEQDEDANPESNP